LADLLAGDELLSTMRDVVGSASFQNLQSLAGSGKGSIQRDALLNQLSRRYLPRVVDEVGQLLNGMLDQPAGSTIYQADLPNRGDGYSSRLNQENANGKTSKTGGRNCDDIHSYTGTEGEPRQFLSRKPENSELSDKGHGNQATYGGVWATILFSKLSIAIGIVMFGLILDISSPERNNQRNYENTTNCERVLADIIAANPEQKIWIYKEHRWQCAGDKIKAAAGL